MPFHSENAAELQWPSVWERITSLRTVVDLVSGFSLNSFIFPDDSFHFSDLTFYLPFHVSFLLSNPAISAPLLLVSPAF
jgi:hypothetical protein